ncbi:MAG: hypothetical protein ABWY22_14785, partial [Flavobacterium sp.]
IHIIENGVKSDSSIYYYPNKNIAKILYYLKKDTVFEKDFSEDSRLLSEGKNLKEKMLGKWKFYKENGNLDKIIEYIDLCGEQYMNQGWYFKDNGDTLYKNSNFVSIKISEGNFKINQKHEFKFIYKRLLGSTSEFWLSISPDVDNKFCNINKINMSNQYSKANQIIAKIGFETPGKKTLRGFISEFKDSIISGEKVSKIAERRVYFEIPVMVK